MTANLRLTPLFIGSPMLARLRTYVAIAGGSGYILNRAALQVWGEIGINYIHQTYLLLRKISGSQSSLLAK